MTGKKRGVTEVSESFSTIGAQRSWASSENQDNGHRAKDKGHLNGNLKGHRTGHLTGNGDTQEGHRSTPARDLRVSEAAGTPDCTNTDTAKITREQIMVGQGRNKRQKKQPGKGAAPKGKLEIETTDSK